MPWCKQDILCIIVHHINIEVLEKKTKYLQKYFTYFQVFVTSLEKHDYNNLTFEVHVNNSLMYLEKNYYPHKIIYLPLLLLRDIGILLITLLFVYTLPCFHLLIIKKFKMNYKG